MMANQTRELADFQTRKNLAERTFSIVGNRDATYRSSLGLLPVDFLAEVSTVSNGTTNDSIQSEGHLPLKYLLPTGKVPDSFAEYRTPRSPSIGWVDQRVASFVAKQATQNESVASTREVDWSNIFQQIEVNQGKPLLVFTDNDHMQSANTFIKNADEKIIKYNQIENQSFSAEALSTSLANRPRSTSFGGSPGDVGTNNKINNTRNECFSDYTNPPGSNYGSIGINESSVGQNNLKEPSYLEDIVFLDQDIGQEFIHDHFGVSNNLQFINQAESEFHKEHMFEHLNTNTPAEQTDFKTRDLEFSNFNMSCNMSGVVEANAKSEECKKLSESVYFAMSTSRLGSLDKPRRINNGETSFTSTTSSSAKVSEDERPNLGFSSIISPKRKPFSVVTKSDNIANVSKGKKVNERELQLSKNGDLTDLRYKPNQSADNSQNSRQQIGANIKEHMFKTPLDPVANQNTKNQSMHKSIKKSSKNRHSSPIKGDFKNSNENIQWPKSMEKTHSSIKAPSSQNDVYHPQNITKNSNSSNERLVYKNVTSSSTLNMDDAQRGARSGFPIAVDKSCLSWLAVEIGKTEEKFVCLQNLTEQTLELRLIIRDCNQYTFKTNRHVNHIPDLLHLQQSITTNDQSHEFMLDAVLQPKETKDVIVQFTPSKKCGFGQKRGKLVIKPRGLGGKTLKASIPLYANVGVPKIVFDESFGTTTGHIPNQITTFMGTLSNKLETEKESQIYNNGDVPAFIRLQAFADMDCRIVSGDDPMDPIRIEPNAFILKPGCNRTIKIYVRPCHGVAEGKHTVAGSILMFSGPEICRQAWRAFKTNEQKNIRSRNQYLVHGEDFDVPFRGETEALNISDKFCGPLTGEEEADFEKKMTITTVKVVGFKAKMQFVTLQVEDTLSESRINCTVLGGSSFSPAVDRNLLPEVRNYDDIAEEQEIEIPLKSVPGNETLHKDDKPKSSAQNCTTTNNKASSSETHTNEIFLQNSKLFFPPVKVGTTGVEKLTIKNRKETPVSIYIQSISLPFKTSLSRFEIKARSYAKLPIVYTPETVGKHKAKILLKSECGKYMEAILTGDSLK